MSLIEVRTTAVAAPIVQHCNQEKASLATCWTVACTDISQTPYLRSRLPVLALYLGNLPWSFHIDHGVARMMSVLIFASQNLSWHCIASAFVVLLRMGLHLGLS